MVKIKELATNSKSILASKTFWVNALVTVIGVFELFVGLDFIKDNPSVVKILLTGVGVLNVFLRSITSRPVTVPLIDA